MVFRRRNIQGMMMIYVLIALLQSWNSCFNRKQCGKDMVIREKRHMAVWEHTVILE